MHAAGRGSRLTMLTSSVLGSRLSRPVALRHAQPGTRHTHCLTTDPRRLLRRADCRCQVLNLGGSVSMWVKDGVAIAQGTTHTYKFTIPQQDEGLRAFKVRSKADRDQLLAD